MKLLKEAIDVLALLAIIFGMSGCMTANVIHEAKAQSDKDNNGNEVVVKKAQPAFYLFLPLTIPGDIATSPFQAACGAFIFTYNASTD